MAFRANGETAPLLPPGVPQQDYKGDQQQEGDPKNGDSPLLSVVEGRKSVLDKERSTLTPFTYTINAGPSSAIDYGLTRPASDTVSVTSFGGNLTTSVPDEGELQNLQDVWDSLEKASALIRKYMHQEELARR